MRQLSPVVLLALLFVSGCAGGSGEPKGPPQTGPAVPDKPKEPELTGVKKRLQGTWEIVRYTSTYRIPPEAMPLMADLFDSLRIRFEPDRAVVRTSKTDDEASGFLIADESGDSFKLKTNGGMFDGASCRFVGTDEWEVTDQGKTWPGVSVLRRAK